MFCLIQQYLPFQPCFSPFLQIPLLCLTGTGQAFTVDCKRHELKNRLSLTGIWIRVKGKGNRIKTRHTEHCPGFSWDRVKNSFKG